MVLINVIIILAYLSNNETGMDLETLRNRQAPLKQQYADDPASGVITMTVTGQIDQTGLAIDVPTHSGTIKAGLHQAAGGDGATACSGDMLLEALVGCAGVTLSAVATAMGIQITNGTISAEGDLDFKGTLGVNRESPVGFKHIRLLFDLQTDAESGAVEKLISLTERYCVIYQTLVNPNQIESSLR
tara:strand:- start:2155 stop:2715 length:561 start_codon:yes stop_codon:yes gene_type:complete